MFELSQDAVVFPGVKLPFLLGFKQLEFEEQAQEEVVGLHLVNVYVQQGFNALETFGELAHCCIMNRVSSVRILLA